MLILKLLHEIRLLLLIATHAPRLLLALIIHHLLNHTPRLAIEVAQFRVLRTDLSHVDSWRTGHDMRPPIHFIDLI